ncbi:hypothetical protein PsAD13_05199 [Pseudovibrio sp. Ad13]|nr:hypothetical protein PsAD13_05199 [Pseudovibrio sp. Ad13]
MRPRQKPNCHCQARPSMYSRSQQRLRALVQSHWLVSTLSLKQAMAWALSARPDPVKPVWSVRLSAFGQSCAVPFVWMVLSWASGQKIVWAQQLATCRRMWNCLTALLPKTSPALRQNAMTRRFWKPPSLPTCMSWSPVWLTVMTHRLAKAGHCFLPDSASVWVWPVRFMTARS